MRFRGKFFNHRIQFFISSVWFFGLLFGLWIAFLSKSGSNHYDNFSVSYHTSAFGVFLSAFIPLIAIIAGILFRLKWFNCIVIFAEAFLYGFNFYNLTVSSGALFRSIQMFSQTFTVLLLLNLTLFSDYNSKVIRQRLLYIVIASVLFCLLDILLTFLLLGN